MSTPRIHVSGTSADLVISKVGYDASDPALADANKIFDSDWLFGGSIILCGVYLWPADGSARTVSFPQAQAETPAFYAWYCQPKGYYTAVDFKGNFNVQLDALTLGGGTAGVYTGGMIAATATTSGIVLPAKTSGNVFMSASDASNHANPYNAAMLVVFGM